MKALLWQKAVMPLIVLLAFSAFNCFTPQNINYDFYSPKSKQLYKELLELSKNTNWTNLNSLVSDEMKQRYGITEEPDGLYVGAKLNINDLYDAEELWKNGIKVGTRINNLVTVKIPLYAYTGLEMIDGLEYVEIDSEVLPRNYNF